MISEFEIPIIILEKSEFIQKYLVGRLYDFKDVIHRSNNPQASTTIADGGSVVRIRAISIIPLNKRVHHLRCVHQLCGLLLNQNFAAALLVAG